MLKRTPAVSTSLVAFLGAAVTVSVVGLAGPANAASTTTAATRGSSTTSTTSVISTSAAARPTHLQKARAHWKAGAAGPHATRIDSFLAARDELDAVRGDRYWHEQDNLTALSRIPGTQTTAKQRATVKRATQELNGFFRTPGLYSIKPGNPRKIARADWIKSHQVASAHRNAWIAGAIDQLHSYGKRYAKQRILLSELLEVPITNTTAEQRALVRRNTRALNDFFNVSARDY